MTRQRRHFTPEQKVALLRQHFLDKVPVSDLCEQHGIAVYSGPHCPDQKSAVLSYYPGELRSPTSSVQLPLGCLPPRHSCSPTQTLHQG